MSEGATLLSPGVTIAGTYEVERKLGHGGMGEVWLAKHTRLAGKLVAVKVLHVDRALPQEALARFKREAEIAARLEHPNIVQVLDFNTLPTGQPYLVMEYLKGHSLAARAQGRPLPLEQVLLVMRQVGAALQAAHRAGVVHRDLKPENIFLVPTALGDQVKVLDFGISKLSDSQTVQTTESVLIGTPLYMSPEQALGHNKDVTAQSDLFSLGSICFELLTGTAPFAADNIAKVVFRIAYEKHPPLAEARGDLPPNVVQAIEHALEKDKSKRTPGIEAFVVELTGQALAEVTPHADEASGVYTPNVPVTPSMLGGATQAPGSRATPAAPQPPPTPAPAPTPGARTVSGRVLVLAGLVVVLVLAGVVAKVRTDNWAERAAYRAMMVDAGYVMLADGTFVDAGPSTSVAPPVVVAAVVDAGEAPDAGALDAGAARVESAAPDAGPRVVERVQPPTPAEASVLADLEQLRASASWDRLYEQRSKVRADLKTPSARVRGLSLVAEAACARGDNSGLLGVLSELRALAPPAQRRKLKERCVALYPSAASFDW